MGTGCKLIKVEYLWINRWLVYYNKESVSRLEFCQSAVSLCCHLLFIQCYFGLKSLDPLTRLEEVIYETVPRVEKKKKIRLQSKSVKTNLEI